MQQGFSVILFRDDEANLPRAAKLKNDRVDERNVIGQKQEAAFWQVLTAKYSNAIHRLSNCESQEIKRALTER